MIKKDLKFSERFCYLCALDNGEHNYATCTVYSEGDAVWVDVCPECFDRYFNQNKTPIVISFSLN